MLSIFRIIAAVLSLYNILCFVRIILTWIPGLSYSQIGNFLAKICDPYLNFFRRFRFLTFGSFDFSPALALCALGALSQIFSSLSQGYIMKISYLVALAVEIIWAIIDSLLIFLIILLAVRLIVLLVKGNDYYSRSPLMESLDRTLYPFVYGISKIFTLGRRIQYRTALIISILTILAVKILLNTAVHYLMLLIVKIIPI